MRQLVVVVTLIGVVLAWTGSAAASHTGWYFGSGGPRVTVTISEWKFTPATITLEVGKPVDIILENKGVLAHVFMVYTKPKQPLTPNASDRWGADTATTTAVMFTTPRSPMMNDVMGSTSADTASW